MSIETKDKEKWLSIQKRQKEMVFTELEDDYQDRIDRLNRLKNVITIHEKYWMRALKTDLGKSEVETYSSEISTVLAELDYAVKNLKNWMDSDKQKSHTPIGKIEHSVIKKPYGSVLIISPWNYPLQLSFVPLIGAIAAGNRCFLKPSEKSHTTSRLMHHLISHYFSSEEIYVVEGEAETAKALLEMEWDHIFFTGSPEVGRKVYEAASRNLTPVTLELGGKNPCIVDETNCTQESVRKIIWGKFINAGQTCIAPDTIYVQESVKERFIQFAIETIQSFYGPDPKQSKDYGRLIDKAHFGKMQDLLTQGEIVYGGRNDEATLFIEPTLIHVTHKESSLANEEIFGPLLPIIPYYSLQELLEGFQDKQEEPLVTYLFTKDNDQISLVDRLTKTGAVMINQVIFHAADPDIPFGGVGKSGFGRYHGSHSYDTFTYKKVIYHQKSDYANKMIFPPYSPETFKLLKAVRTLFR